MTEPREHDGRRCCVRAAGIGAAAGLRYVYAGNLPGRSATSSTRTARQCGETLIERYGYLIRAYNLTPGGRCPSCGTQIPGRWSDDLREQRTAIPFSVMRGPLR